MIECIDIDYIQVLGTFDILDCTSVKSIIFNGIYGIRELNISEGSGILEAIGRNLTDE